MGNRSNLTSDGPESTVLERVRKLMDKAGATTNAHEAEAFAAKAAELVARHRIDPSQITAGRRHEHLSVREFALGRGAYVRGRLALLTAIASAHDAKVVFDTTSTGMVAYVAGFSSDLDVIEVMYHSLHGQVAAQMAGERRKTAAATQRFRRSFLFGYAERLGQLLLETRRSVEAEPADGGAGTALALQERSRQVEEFAAEEFGRTRRARAAGEAQASGWLAGAAAAEQADVGRTRLAGRRALGRG